MLKITFLGAEGGPAEKEGKAS